MFDSLPEVPETLVKSGKYGPFNQTKREARTRWVLNPEAEGMPQVVVDLTTYHRGDRKQFSTSLTWATVEKRERHPHDGPGVVAIETWGSDHQMIQVYNGPVARYSVKAMVAHHKEALAHVEANMGFFGSVFQQAAERNGLTEQEAS